MSSLSSVHPDDHAAGSGVRRADNAREADFESGRLLTAGLAGAFRQIAARIAQLDAYGRTFKNRRPSGGKGMKQAVAACALFTILANGIRHDRISPDAYRS